MRRITADAAPGSAPPLELAEWSLPLIGVGQSMRVAVTGVGVLAPEVRGPEALWARLLAPVEPTPGPWPHEGWRGFFLDPEVTCAGIALEAARDALVAHEGPDPWLIVGSCSAGQREVDGVWQAAEAGEAVDPAQVMWPQLPHRPGDALRAALGLRTPTWTVSTACTSGAVALGSAASLVASGEAPCALAVGVDVIGKLTWFGFGSLGLQSDGRCRPFDRTRSGLNLGEAAAALLLEPEAAVKARGGAALGWVTGYGNATDAWHMSTPDPAGTGALTAIGQALGGRAPGWVNAHGTGTPLNDAVEARVLEQRLPGVPVTANKGALGHTLGAAGAIEALVTLLGLARGEVPPSIALQDPEFGLDLVQAPRPLACRAALSVNLAFGGSNTALLLEAP